MFVVTLPPSARKDPAAFARRAKREGADILEVRSDLTPRVMKFSSPLPILLALRGADHALLQHLKPAYIDVETQDLASLPKTVKIILSFHDYEKTPTLATLKALTRAMQRQKPWAIKIATFVRTYDELVTLMKLQDWLQKSGQRSIVLGMGPKVHLSRITSPYRNVFTYATLSPSDASAPGQFPMALYRLLKGRKKPKLLGIVGGQHITASLSPVIHNALFMRHKIDALYSCFPSEDFSSTMKALEKLGVTGLSVTAPFKHDAFHVSSSRERVAEKLGVANTLLRSAKKWKGFITDSYGIREGYPALAGVKNVAILGAGGALPSAILAVRDRSPKAQITVFARDPKKASKNLKKFGVKIDALKNVTTFTADAVLCAISADVSFPLPLPASKHAIAIDLRYGKDTLFMQSARRKKFRVTDGTNMLMHQALKQFQYFTGKKAYDDDAAFLRPILNSFLSSHGT